VTRFETSVRISRPIEDVFAYVSNPLNLPRWNSAVRAVRRTHGQDGDVGSTYTMERALPNGRVHNELAIVAHAPPAEFGIRTTSGPTPFNYRYRFSTANGETLVHLDAVVELTGAAALLHPLAGRAIKRGVDDNFGELKRLLEAIAELGQRHSGPP
jgi:uncharacterized protein YndB with AHSA1/START domain